MAGTGGFGAAATAAAVRTWRRDGRLLAIGFLDGPDVLRLTVSPAVWCEDELAHQVVADLAEPRRGVLPSGKVAVEIEPMGVHTDHRGRGYGRAICLAAAAELKRLGSSSALVCTLSSLTGAVASYRSAGFQQLPERLDRVRDLP